MDGSAQDELEELALACVGNVFRQDPGSHWREGRGSEGGLHPNTLNQINELWRPQRDSNLLHRLATLRKIVGLGTKNDSKGRRESGAERSFLTILLTLPSSDTHHRHP